MVGAGVSPSRFARAAAPAQVVAFGTHSSMASLPAMIDGAETRLGLSQTATGFVLPLSLAVFKYSGPIWFVVVTYFVGRLYDVAIDPVAARSRSWSPPSSTSFAIGGVPSGAVVVVAPVLAAAGLPVEAMGLLLAVDPIPNALPHRRQRDRHARGGGADRRPLEGRCRHPDGSPRYGRRGTMSQRTVSGARRPKCFSDKGEGTRR